MTSSSGPGHRHLGDLPGRRPGQLRVPAVVVGLRRRTVPPAGVARLSTVWRFPQTTDGQGSTVTFHLANPGPTAVTATISLGLSSGSVMPRGGCRSHRSRWWTSSPRGRPGCPTGPLLPSRSTRRRPSWSAGRCRRRRGAHPRCGAHRRARSPWPRLAGSRRPASSTPRGRPTRPPRPWPWPIRGRPRPTCRWSGSAGATWWPRSAWHPDGWSCSAPSWSEGSGDVLGHFVGPGRRRGGQPAVRGIRRCLVDRVSVYRVSPRRRGLTRSRRWMLKGSGCH